MATNFDIIIIGGGIAGFGVAAYLDNGERVLVLEKEDFPGVHATGRSAALFSETYGSPPIRALSRASRPFLTEPPGAFELASPLHPRGVLYIASVDQEQRLQELAANPLMKTAVEVLDEAQARARCPLLKPGYVASALWEPHAQDLDVDALLQAFVKKTRSAGGTIVTSCEVTAITKSPTGWRVRAGGQEYEAAVVVNAAGAWADGIAELAGVGALGVQPFLRTAVLVDPPANSDIAEWPCVMDIDEGFYFKPDAGKLLLSPADEQPVEPCDAQPEELDVAIAVDRVQQATTLEVQRVEHRWAGLRSFAPDRVPVVGFAPNAPGFFWLAGQGGYGVQTAPALSRVAAALVTGNDIPIDIREAGLDPDVLSPARFLGRVAAAQHPAFAK